MAFKKMMPTNMVTLFCLGLLIYTAKKGDTQEKPLIHADLQKSTVKLDAIEGFLLTTGIDKKSYKPVEPVILSVKLQNQRKTDAPYWMWPVLEIFHLKVLTPSGKPAVLTEYGKQEMLRSLISRSTVKYLLKPGGEISASIILNRLYDMSVGGEYKISVESNVPTENDITKWVTIRSNLTSMKIDY